MTATLHAPLLHEAVSTIFAELVHGAEARICWVLNPRDPGLLASLDRLSADAASAPAPGGGASIAAHADHLRFGYSLLIRWAQGEKDPFTGADFGASWTRGTVTEAEWAARREYLYGRLEAASQELRRANEIAVHPSTM